MFPNEDYRYEFVSTILWNQKQNQYHIIPDEPFYRKSCTYHVAPDDIEYWVTMNGWTRHHTIIKNSK